MLTYSNYVTYGDRLQTVKNSFLGGDVVGILLRQSIRLKALLAQAAFKRRQQELGTLGSGIFTNPVSFIADIPVTVIQQEAYSFQSDMTRFPVESDAIVSDHVILQPLRIDMSFEVSNWESGTAQYAMELLEALWRLREPVDLMTYYRKIPNMVLISCQMSNSVPQWGKIGGRVTFQQLGLSVLEADVYKKKEVVHNERTGGPDTAKSANPAENVGLIQPKVSILEKGRRAVFGDD